MTKQNNQAAYDIIITGPVRQDVRLSDSQRLLYGELRGLCRKEGFCWASNTYLAKLRDKQVRAVQNDLRKLEACGHIQVEYDPENKNLRKIFMTDGMQKNAYPMQKKTSLNQGMQKNAQGMKIFARGMQNNDVHGMQKIAPSAAGIRKNINITSSSCEKTQPRAAMPQKNDDDVKNIPEKITKRFDTIATLWPFSVNCGHDAGLMQRYLDYADQAKARNPVGLAVKLARERKTAGPPDGSTATGCGFCALPAKKYAIYEGRKIGMCAEHNAKYAALRESKQHLVMLAGAK
jgi:hypothetical protein